ncbi:adenosylcobinamide hydrolase [Halobiforma haloterrestris]|uniref:Adenosylcobinamide hydrolase n=1 Tax=Natronobacterium haloterrestre TaxID=148448 RepID=A0A1I1EKZ9_NATHA|nr:adenosylcobinamide amidohydrolase [Halobiforma haloterrestris]SFB87302.1 adenosylcobinamide hydrolase [Halobiforma haloterrestris]
MTGEPDPDALEADYEAIRRDGVLRVTRSGTDAPTEWLSTGWHGGRKRADCAYNVSVPEGWERTDLERYVGERLDRAGVDAPDAADRGPVLLTGVDMADARGARCGPVTAYATAGISNPAALPIGEALEASESDPDGESLPDPLEARTESPEPGTVNVLVGTTRTLAPGALANLVAVAAEAKAATLLAEAGFPGTTTDAVVVGHDPTGDPRSFSGSATEVGAATRACVREAVGASLEAHYADRDETLPDSSEDAIYGVSTDARAAVFRPNAEEPPGAEPDISGDRS